LAIILRVGLTQGTTTQGTTNQGKDMSRKRHVKEKTRQGTDKSRNGQIMDYFKNRNFQNFLKLFF